MECFSSYVRRSSASESSVKEKKCGGKRGKAVKLSTDAQSVAARERRHRVSERFKILQSLVPGGSKMDTVSMLEEAIHYVKFLKTQIWLHQAMINFVDSDPSLFLTPIYAKATDDLYAQVDMGGETHAFAALLPQIGSEYSGSVPQREENIPLQETLLC